MNTNPSTVLRRCRFVACTVALFFAAFSRHAWAAPRFSIDDVAVPEGPVGTTVNATFTVQLSSAAAGITTVTFNTVGVTAAAGSDFVAQSRVLTFPTGTTSQTVDVVVKGDADGEADETFHATLSHATGGANIARAIGTGTILDDDTGNNDNFAHAFGIEVDSTDAGNISAATAEPGEEAQTEGFYAGKSIWWRWTASHSGMVTANTFGTAFDTLLAVYTGDSIAHLQFVTFSDDASDTIPQSQVQFTAVAGTTYSFLVDAFKNAPLNGGAVQFSLGDTGSVGSSFGINDVTVTEGAAGGTVNATFTVQLMPAAAVTTTVDFDTVSDSATAGPDYVPQNRVLTFPANTTSQSVTVVVKGDAGAEADETFHVLLSHASEGAGIAKAIGIGTIEDDDGTAATNNDAFGNARVLAGDFAADAGNNSAATAEAGEPNPGFFAGKSIWWRWTAPRTGMVTANTFGSAFDTTLAVYTGSSLATLTTVAVNDDTGKTGASVGQSEVRFKAVAGKIYSFAVDRYLGAPANTGSVVFSVEAFAPGTTKFHGLIGPTSFDGADVGVLDVSLTEGSFKASGIFNAKTFKFDGSLDANGSYAGGVEVKGLGDVTFTLSFDNTGATDFATGTVTLGGTVAQIRLDAASFSKDHPAPQVGAYTFAIPFDPLAAPLAPRAHGSGTVKVSETGAVLLSGRLGDGTTFSSKALVNASGVAHCFTLLNAKKGSVSLALDFTPTADADFTGQVCWAHPPTTAKQEAQAFTAVLGTLGSHYEKPNTGVRVLPGFNATAGAGTATLTDGNFAGATRTINLGTDNKITVFGSTEALQIKITLSNGLVTGSFKNPATNKVGNFKGAVLRKSSEIYGLFPGDDKNGALFVKPGP